MLGILLGAAVFAAPPPDVDLSPFDFSAWGCPGTAPYSVSKSSAEATQHRASRCSMRQRTKDPFDKVVAHYQATAGARGMSSSNNHVTAMDCSAGRPVKLVLIERRWSYGSVTVVISRGDGEELTHITLLYRTPTLPGPDDDAGPRRPDRP